LTTQLLAFSRQQPINPEPVDVNRIVAGMLPLLQGALGSTIQIELQPNPNIATALADSGLLELAIMNLAINARDSMPDGGKIEIRTGAVSVGAPSRPEEPEAGDYVFVAVADTGTGMPPDVQQKAFEPYFTTKPVGKGTGLGLPQVLGMAKQLGGGIGLVSTPGQGSCLSIFLPRAEEPAARFSSIERAAPASSQEKPRILLVDDNAAVREVAMGLLEDAAFCVVPTADGASALNLLRKDASHFDLLITDIAMPGMSGVELSEIVNRTWPHLPVLFISGYAAGNLLPESARKNLLGKPFTGRQLIAKVREVLAEQARCG
jgi:CheY-like chemotaxis protein